MLNKGPSLFLGIFYGVFFYIRNGLHNIHFKSLQVFLIFQRRVKQIQVFAVILQI